MPQLMHKIRKERKKPKAPKAQSQCTHVIETDAILLFHVLNITIDIYTHYIHLHNFNEYTIIMKYKV